MKQSIQKLLNNETFVAALLILLTTVITYGISISKLGYYHDDWFLLWSGQARGAGSIIPLFASDRPFMGVIYSFLYRILGNTSVNWHLYALLWRFIGGLAFFWILRLIWPDQKYYDNPDDGAVHCLSGVFITAECKYKAKSSLWVWDSTSFDCVDA